MKSRKIGRINGTRKYGNNVRKNTVKRGGRFTGFFRSFSKEPTKNLEAIEQGEKRFGITYGSYRSQIAEGLLQILDKEISNQMLIVETASNNIVDHTTFKSEDNLSMEHQRDGANKRKKILEKVKKYYTGEDGNLNIAQAMALYAHKSSLERNIYHDMIDNYGNTTKFFDFAIEHASSQNLESSIDNSISEKSKVRDTALDDLEDKIVNGESMGSMNAKPDNNKNSHKPRKKRRRPPLLTSHGQ